MPIKPSKINTSAKVLISLLVVLLVIVLFNFNKFIPVDRSVNPAEETIRPVVTTIQNLGCIEVCKLEHSGIPSLGNFNKQPYIQLYYKFTTEPPELTKIITQSFQNIGYTLTEDTEAIASLKNEIQQGGDGDGYTNESDFLNYSRSSVNFTARIQRNTKVVNRCEDFNGPNSHISASGKEAIVVLWITLAPR